MILNKKVILVLVAFFMFVSAAPSLAAGEMSVRIKVDGMV
jgi:hypothetical protein